MKRKIGILTVDPAGRGGVWYMAKSLYRLHTEWGIESRVVFLPLIPAKYRNSSLPRWQLSDLEDEGVPMTALPRPFMRGSPLQMAANAALHQDFLRKFDAWIVASGSSNAGLPLALLGIPYFLWVATTLAEELEAQASLDPASWAAQASNQLLHNLYKIEGFVYRRASLIASISQYTTRQIHRTFPDIRTAIYTLAVPIDTSECIAVTNKPFEGAKLIFTGRADDPRKDMRTLFVALRLLLDQFPRTCLLIVGSDAESARKQAEESGVAGAVTFIPYVSRQELIRCYQEADIFVMTSRQEGFGISLVEAMACGLPVVTTRCGAPEEIVEDGVSGFLVPVGDASGFAYAVMKLLADPGLRHRFGLCGRTKVEANYSWAKMGTELRTLLLTSFPAVYASGA